MPPKKRGGRSVGSVRAKMGTHARKNKNTTPNSLPVLSFDVLTETVCPIGTSTRKVTTTANNEMQIKLSNGAESDISKTTLVADNLPRQSRITRNNCLKARLRKENDADNDIKTDSVSNAQPVKTMSRQQQKVPAARKRKLVRNNSIDSNDSYMMTKRRCQNKRGLNQNNIKVRKETMSKNRNKSKKKIVNTKKRSAAVAQTISNDRSSNSPRKVTEVRNKEAFNFEVTISSRALTPQPVEPVTASPASDCPSWTKDISNSSTVTCLTVRSEDIVRIDNKLPMVKLTDVGDLTFNSDIVNNDQGDFVANGDSVNKSDDNIAKDVEKACAHAFDTLTTSSDASSSSTSSEGPGGYQSADDEIDKALQKLTTEFKKKDMEIIDLITCDNTIESSALQNIRNRVCKALPEESEIIAHCRALKNMLLRDYEELMSDIDDPRKNNEEVERVTDEAFIKPQDIRKVIRRDNTNDPPPKGFGDDKARGGTGSYSGPVDDRANDDDDALSLFAESITGLDSSRKNDSLPTQANSPVGESGEYVPQPINNNKQYETITYRPSQISKQNEDSEQNQTVKMVCEKQNADSTSMYRETRNYCDNIENKGVGDGDAWRCPAASQAIAEPAASQAIAEPAASQAIAEPAAPQAIASPDTPTTPRNAQPYPKPWPSRAGRPLFISDIYIQPKKFESNVFLGLCFFNVALKCKRDRCQFSHADLDAATVADRLRSLNGDVLFIQEYMIMRNWVSLRRKYGLLFVLEAIRRELTGVVLEMAIDFTQMGNLHQPEDKTLTVKVQEAILLYMNTINVCEYGEFFKFPITEGIMLCDIFMKSLASTQNFSRFKTIFINLTNFIDRIPRQFSFAVASSLLERVCILPHDVNTAKAMLAIMRRTSSNILQNSMIGLFEQQLSANEDLCREFELLKQMVDEPAVPEVWMPAGAPLTPPLPRCSFSPDTTGPDWTNIMTEHAIESQLVDSFNQLGQGCWAGAVVFGGAPKPRLPRPPRPLRRFDGPMIGRMTPSSSSIAFNANRPGATPLVRPPRPLFRFHGHRPNYQNRFVQNNE